MSGDRPRRKPIPRLIFALGLFVLLALPCGMVAVDLMRPKETLSVAGKVIRTSPEGPFPEVVTVEYQDHASRTHQVEIPTSYTTARVVGDAVDLDYPPDSPANAMTRAQLSDEGWSVTAYVLFECIAVVLFFILLVFSGQLSRENKEPR
jgi:hypothetical protein